MKRKEQLFIPLSDDEKRDIVAASTADDLPQATWARRALIREARKSAPASITRNDGESA